MCGPPFQVGPRAADLSLVPDRRSRTTQPLRMRLLIAVPFVAFLIVVYGRHLGVRGLAISVVVAAVLLLAVGYVAWLLDVFLHRDGGEWVLTSSANQVTSDGWVGTGRLYFGTDHVEWHGKRTRLASLSIAYPEVYEVA